MAGGLRIALRIAAVATLGLAAWLATVVVLVLPARDPDHVGLWTLVALGATGLALLSFVASSGRGRPSPAPAVGLAVLGVASLVFGLFVIGSSMSDALTADPEGYLVVIGLLLAVHGVVALAWTAAVTPRPR